MSENQIQTTQQTAPATKADKPKATIDAYLRGAGFQQEIMKLMGGEKSIAERFARVALSQVMTPNEKGRLALLDCTVESLCRCLYAIAGAGLEPGRDAYLIPRADQCTVIIKWQGYVRAARASGEIKRIWSNVIRKGDTYKIRAGSLSPGIEHSWDLDTQRGDIIGAYACAEWTDGTVETEVVTREYLDRCRAQGEKNGPSPAWKNWPDRQSMKVVTKRLCERLPLGADASDKLAKVEAADGDESPDGFVVDDQAGEPTKTEKLTASLKARTGTPKAVGNGAEAAFRTRIAKACAAAGFKPEETAGLVTFKYGDDATLDSLDAASLQELAAMVEDPALARAQLEGIKNIG